MHEIKAYDKKSRMISSEESGGDLREDIILSVGCWMRFTERGVVQAPTITTARSILVL